MNPIEKLAEIFAKFPGIGPRQARRFVYFLLAKNGGYSDDLIGAVQELKKQTFQCRKCMRFFSKTRAGVELCQICQDETRDSTLLCIVPRDVDLDAVEKSGTYNGFYFVLGGTVPILEKEPEKRIRLKELESRLKSNGHIKEIILAMNANQDGENTAEFIKERLSGFKLEVSSLGRGLSTGAELEYADPETLKSAFKNRVRE